MNSSTFTDVSSKTWCYSGVKTAYNKGIMLGYTDKTFRPNNNVSWAEAITIAARIHAAYNDNLIAEPSMVHDLLQILLRARHAALGNPGGGKAQPEHQSL